MAVSKVILNGDTLIDVTVDTVTSEKLLSGYQATGRDGVKVQGSYVPTTVSLTSGSADPSESSQHITPPSGYDGFSYFDVGAIDSDYVGSGIARNSSTDLSASGSVVTVPSGYYAVAATKNISGGSATTPTTTINATPNISVDTSGKITAGISTSSNITPSIIAGYISTGTSGVVTVSGSSNLQLSTEAAKSITPTTSEQTAVASGKYTLGTIKVKAIPSQYIIPSGSTTFVANDTYDVTNLASVVVQVPSDMPETQHKTATPTESEQTVYPDTGKLLSYVVVNAIDSSYVGSAIERKSSADLSASGSVVSVPSGYYSIATSTNISSGSATTPAKTISVTPSISINSSTGVITATAAGSSSITPTVSAGYVSSGTAGTVSVSGSNTSALSTQGATTITPTENVQTAVASGKFTLGNITVAAIPSDYIGSAISSVEIVEGTTTVSGSTATRGVATWSAGVIQSGQINAATFANSSSAQTQYIDISNTTDAPVLVSGGYLYINKGYTDDLKISLAKLVPDGASADLASDKILSGYAAYNNDGALIAGNIPSKSSTDITVAGPTITVPSGYYSVAGSTTIKSGNVAVYDRSFDVGIGTISLDSSIGMVSINRNEYNSTFRAVTNAGYIEAFEEAGQLTVNSASGSYQLATISATSITPSESSQVAVESGKFTLGNITVAAISSDYVGSAIAWRSSTDLSFNNGTFTAPSGYYETQATKVIASASAPEPSITLTSSTGKITSTVAVSSAWYPASSSSSSYQLNTAAASTITPTESVQTAVESGKYTLGNVTVAAISSDYVGSNIAQHSSADLTISGAVVSVPSGYYSSTASTAVASGAISAVAMPSFIPEFSVNNDGIVTVTQNTVTSVLPTLTSGYIDTVSPFTVVVAGTSNYQLPVITTTTIDQIVSS